MTVGLSSVSEIVVRPQRRGVKVEELMSRPVITVKPDTGIKKAAQMLVELGISAMPVLGPKGELVGIVSEADLLPLETRADPLTQATPLKPTAGTSPTTVEDVMTRDVLVVDATSEVSQAARIMLEAGIKRVPVMRGRQLVGILSRRDLIKVIARRDEDIEKEMTQRLDELGVAISSGSVSVAAGIATIRMDYRNQGRRLVESVALTVPGVLEVRFLPN
jgi:CBS-domain-containing membrane protein